MDPWRQPVAPNWNIRHHLSAKFQAWPTEGMRECHGSVRMTRVIIDVVLFSCMSAIVIGIVIAAANFLS
jgi:hypothetical protein